MAIAARPSRLKWVHVQNSFFPHLSWAVYLDGRALANPSARRSGPRSLIRRTLPNGTPRMACGAKTQDRVTSRSTYGLLTAKAGADSLVNSLFA